MPIVGNRFYNDPNIGAAFNNLASMFAPPSGADAAGWANAAATKAEASRLAELFRYAIAPNYDQSAFDRLGQAAGQWTPSSGYYGVNAAAETARRGQDISSGDSRYSTDRSFEMGRLNNRDTNLTTQRGQDLDYGASIYGTDTTAATSRANNADDNTRALRQTGMEQEGALARLYAQPVLVNEGQRAFLPNQTAAATGFPGQLAGNIAVNQGERVVTPDGQTIEGAPKPLSMDEVQAAVFGELPADLQRSIVTSDAPVETVSGGEGGSRIVYRGDAVGQHPAPPNPGDPRLSNYQTPDGRSGTAQFDPARGWVDTQTGEVLPAGSQTFSASLQGSGEDTGFGPTTANTTDNISQRSRITRTLAMLDVQEQAIRQNPGTVGLVGWLRGTAQNAAASIDDLAQAFGKDVPEMQVVAADVKAGLSRVAPQFFDPAIPETQARQMMIAYMLAQSLNPQGEVSRQAFERANEVIDGGWLGNSQSALASIQSVRELLQAQLQGADVLSDPTTARTDTGFQPPAGSAPAAAERWERVNGVLQRVQ